MTRMLRAASRRLSLHMPGHGGRAPLFSARRLALRGAFPLDTTELGCTDDAYAPRSGIAEAERLFAEAAGAAGSILLHGGSSAGVHAMLLYALHRGERVILPRNAHHSAVSACMLYGFEPIFPELSMTDDGLLYTSAKSYLSAIARHPEARAALVVSPDYYGVMTELASVAKAAHENGMLLLVDEAHGARLCWTKSNAARLGADLSVQSAHKTLPALTGAAVLHYNSAVDGRRLRRLLRMAQTSSPSFLLALSSDDARDWMDANGQRALALLRREIARFWRGAEALGYRNAHEGWRAQGLTSFDDTRLAIDAPQGGYALAEALAGKGIDAELCDDRRAVCILSLLNGKRQLRALLRALKALGAPARAELPALSLPGAPERAIPLGEAMRFTGEDVPLERAAGRVVLQPVGLYPPGVPLALPGEILSRQAAALLARAPGDRRFGLADGLIRCMTAEEMRQ